MKYPIDAEKYISALQIELGPNEAAEEIYRILIPAVNAAYRAGLDGKSGYSKDPETMIAGAWKGAEVDGLAVKLAMAEVRWLNGAYAQGRRDTEGAGA